MTEDEEREKNLRERYSDEALQKMDIDGLMNVVCNSAQAYAREDATLPKSVFNPELTRRTWGGIMCRARDEVLRRFKLTVAA